MRYSMHGPARAAAALMPAMHRTPAASSYGLVHVFGQPGTQGIASPGPSALPQISGDPRTMPSRTAPGLIFPALYRVRALHGPVATRSTNALPVPAVGVRALPGIAQRSRRVGGRTQVVQPLVVQTWPAWRGGGS